MSTRLLSPPRAVPLLAVAVLLAALALITPPPAAAAERPSRLYACVTQAYKTLNLSTKRARCPRGERKISWSAGGERGKRGPRGARGLQGVTGSAGAPGAVGVTGATGAVGATGAQGAPGERGSAGPSGPAGAQGPVGPAGSPDTPDDVLAKLLQVDGPGSGLDSEYFGGLAVDVFQKRVTGTCAAGSAIREVAEDGTVECQSTAVEVPLALTVPADEPQHNALNIELPNTSGSRGVNVQHNGVGPGVFANTIGGNSIWGITGSISSAAVIGDSSSGEAVVARQNGAICEQNIGKCNGIGALVGRHDGQGGYGVRGFVTDPNGAIGVLGQAGISGGTGTGVRGENVNAANAGNAVEGVTNGQGAGIFGQGPNLAGLFNGDVQINGDLTVTGTTNGFTVDDPRSPTTQSLTHTPVQTDELTVEYSGNVTTDAEGRATVHLPDYATTLGTDWRYQLTPIGRFGQVIVEREVDAAGSFVVRSETGDTKVSWAVTGVRHDPEATSSALQVETQKTGADRGRYADPSHYGAPATRSLARRVAPTTEQPGAASRPKLASER
ncbi:MAG: collagen-like protein [Patulibacter sp.]|nr:collagen-like protein [Patulibacter sp.]